MTDRAHPESIPADCAGRLAHLKRAGRSAKRSGSSATVSPTLRSSPLALSMCVNHMARPLSCSTCMKMPSQPSPNFQLSPLSIQTRGTAMELLSTTMAAHCALNCFTCDRTAGMHCARVSGESKALAICMMPRGACSLFLSRVLACLRGGCVYTRGCTGSFLSRSASVDRTISVANSSTVSSDSALVGGLAASLGVGAAGVMAAWAPPPGTLAGSAAGASAAALALRRAATSLTKPLPLMDTPSCTSSRFVASISQALSASSAASSLRPRAARASALRW
mmetsp:Transcript_4608/g.13493  ORF Transcript_4608/g.13493 Transcript_4608/m.13493 type:complete len:279 (+) Transcript_4608:386-1222(+)